MEISGDECLNSVASQSTGDLVEADSANHFMNHATTSLYRAVTQKLFFQCACPRDVGQAKPRLKCFFIGNVRDVHFRGPCAM